MILFVDDMEVRRETFRAVHPTAIFAENVAEAEEILLTQDWEEVWLDHDLGPPFMDSADPESGGALAKWIAVNQPSINIIFIHSANPVGAQDMFQTLTAAGYMAVLRPFNPKDLT